MKATCLETRTLAIICKFAQINSMLSGTAGEPKICCSGLTKGKCMQSLFGTKCWPRPSRPVTPRPRPCPCPKSHVPRSPPPSMICKTFPWPRTRNRTSTSTRTRTTIDCGIGYGFGGGLGCGDSGSWILDPGSCPLVLRPEINANCSQLRARHK